MNSRRQLRAVLTSAAVLGAMFLLCRKCVPFWLTFHSGHWQFPLWYAVAVLVLPSLWVFALLLMAWKSRLVLVLCTVIACVGSLTVPDWRFIPVPALESSAVKSLSMSRAALVSDRSKNDALGFSDALPNIETGFPVSRFYDLRYRPQAIANGRIERFEIEATLKNGARSCGCSRNFVVDTDGVVHYTKESRSATLADPIADLPPTAQR